MADKIIETEAGPGGPVIVERWVDMGDNTWARKVAAGSGGLPGSFGVGATGLIMNNGGRRGPEVLHRSAVTAIDCLLPPGALTLSAITEGGSTLAAAAVHVLVAAGNRFGITPTSPDPGTITPTLNQAVRVAIPQVVGADRYSIYCSTAVAPLFLCQITEVQRGAGGFICSTMGVVTAGGGAPAGSFDIGIMGTGIASTVIATAPINFAFVPMGITPFNSDGFQTLWLSVKISVTDLRVLPSCAVHVFRQGILNPADWFWINVTSFAPMGATNGQPLLREVPISTQGATACVAVLGQVAGQGASVDMWVSGS